KREPGGVVQDLEALLAPQPALALGDEQGVRELQAPHLRYPAVRGLEKVERGIGEGGALVFQEPGERDRAVEDDGHSVAAPLADQLGDGGARSCAAVPAGALALDRLDERFLLRALVGLLERRELRNRGAAARDDDRFARLHLVEKLRELGFRL